MYDVYLCIYICTTYIYVYIYVCTTYIYVYIYIYYLYLCIYIYICMYYVYLCIYICKYYVYLCMYDWIGLAQDSDSWRTLVSAVMNLWVPWNAGNFLTSCKPVGFSRRALHHGVSKYVCMLIDKVTCISITSSFKFPKLFRRSISA